MKLNRQFSRFAAMGLLLTSFIMTKPTNFAFAGPLTHWYVQMDALYGHKTSVPSIYFVADMLENEKGLQGSFYAYTGYEPTQFNVNATPISGTMYAKQNGTRTLTIVGSGQLCWGINVAGPTVNVSAKFSEIGRSRRYTLESMTITDAQNSKKVYYNVSSFVETPINGIPEVMQLVP